MLSILSYSLRVSLLIEIAERAHVSIEGVIRVLTREPVSDAIKERVLAVLDELDAEQTRVLQRFALAALHDVLLRPNDAAPHFEGDVVRGPEYVDLPRALLPAGPEPAPEQLPAPPDTAHLVQLSSVLEELAEAVRDLRRETDTERRERVDDLAVLIELISTGWQGLDRRLGRLERQLGRLEAPRAQTPAPAPAPAPVVPRTLPPPPSEPPPAVAPPTLPPAAEPGARGERDRLPLAAALALVGVVVGTLAVLQLVSGDAEIAGVVSAGGNDTLVDTAEEEAPTTVATTQAATTQAATTTRAVTTTRGITTPPAETTARPSPPATTTTAVLGTEAETPRTTAPTTTTAASSGFRPTRNWAWAPAPDADYYAVQFAREGATIYRTTTRVPRLTLPDSLEFRPGVYRWIVRPGFGSPSDARLGAPLVDSGFTVRS
jgi:hypothetical protein